MVIIITMYSKILLTFLFVCFISEFSHGQKSKGFFRKDYTYIETSEGFYKIHTIPQNWADAKQMCVLEGASLFYPENDHEVHTVMLFWNSTQPALNRAFVGMTDLISQGIFETIDGKLLSEVFHKWMPGEPNNLGGKEHCVNLYKPGLINDCPCDIKEPFICKKSLQSLDWNYQCNMPNLDYTFNEDTGKCYKLHKTPLNWNEAYNICRVEESSLVVINNVLEANYLANFTKSTVKPRMKWNYQRGIYHVGFHNRFKEGWQTVKGTPMNVDPDAWWDNYQPEGDNHEECGSMFYTGRLVNIDCGTRSFFICEHEPALREDEFVNDNVVMS